MLRIRLVRLTWFVLLAAGGSSAKQTPAPSNGDVFGPLEVGADYASYRKVTDKPFNRSCTVVPQLL